MNSLLLPLIGLLEKHPQKSILTISLIFALTASGSVHTIGIGLMLFFTLWPVLSNCIGLDDKELISYLKAYGKSQNAQRAILWLGSVIFLSFLRTIIFQLCGEYHGPHSRLLQGFDLNWLFLLPLIYSSFFCLSTLGVPQALRSFAASPGFERTAACMRYLLFMAAFLLSVATVCNAPHGPVSWFGNWLISSAIDANLPGMHNVFQAHVAIFSEHRFVSFASPAVLWLQGLRAFCTITFSILLWGQGSRLAIFLTNFSRRAAGNLSSAGLVESYLETMAAPSVQLCLKDGHNWLLNSGRSLVWLGSCYLFLLWFFGLSQGPLGQVTTNLILDNYFQAGFEALRLQDIPRLRLFFAAIYALYGTIPLAVSACAFFPTGKARRIILNEDGITAPTGSGLELRFFPFRPWSDVQSITDNTDCRDLSILNSSLQDFRKHTLTIKFFTGGTLRVPLAKLSARECDTLIGAIDEMAANCQVSPAVAALRLQLQPLLKNEKEFGQMLFPRQSEHKSTVFVVRAPGDYLVNDGTVKTASSDHGSELSANAIRIVRLLGTRPLSAIYLGRRGTGDLVVVKQFYLSGSDEMVEGQALKRIFRREHELLKKLNHPDIARVLDVFEEKESSFLVLQHWQGTDLRSLISRRGPLSEKQIIEYALQICRLMRYLHERDQPLLHRDLSPDNLIVAPNNQIKLIDFGAAKEFLAGVTGTLTGKQNYMAPEQIRGEASVQSDIYTFACTLHYLLTGLDPVALSPSSPAQHTKTAVWLDTLLRSCSAFDASERPRSFADLAFVFARAKVDPPEQLQTLVCNLNKTATETKNQASPYQNESCQGQDRGQVSVPATDPDCPVYPSFMLTLNNINASSDENNFAVIKTNTQEKLPLL